MSKEANYVAVIWKCEKCKSEKVFMRAKQINENTYKAEYYCKDCGHIEGSNLTKNK